MEKVLEVVRIKQMVIEREEYLKNSIKSPKDAAKLVMNEIGDEDREVFMVLVLNVKNQVNAIYRCHVGSINASIVHPREVMKVAILNNGASIIVGHNHPSQNLEASPEDIEVTKRLVEAGQLMGIELLDHVIVSENNFNSLKEKGYL